MRVRCPHCDQKYDLDDALMGQELTCQPCGGAMRFDPPAPDPIPAADPAPVEAVLEQAPVVEDSPKRKTAGKRRKMRMTKSSSKQTVAAAPPPKHGGGKGLLLVVLIALAGAGYYGYKRFAPQLGAQGGAAEAAESATDSTAAENAAFAAAMVEHRSQFETMVKPFFEQHCIQCHGPDKEKADLRVDQLLADVNDHYSMSHFQNIIDELTTQNMPPDDEPQPDPQEVVEVMEALTQLINAAKTKHSSGGGRPVRRLTRTEYINTVWDQLGVYTDETKLPDDLLVGDFETNAESLFMTDMHLQAYLLKSRGIVKRFIASRDKKPGSREIPVKYAPGLTSSAFSFVATDVPPAGKLTIRTAWWLRDAGGNNGIAVGPVGGTLEHDVTGTPSSPQAIDFDVHLPVKAINWQITRSNVPSVNLAKGLSKQENAARIKKLGKLKLNANTLIKAQERMLKHPVVLGRIKHVQVVSRQPYDFFAPYLRRGDKLPDSSAPMIIKKFAELVKRGRPVDSEMVSKLYVVFKQGRKMGMPFWEAMVEPMAISMCSMDTMMHFENRDPAKETRTVSGVELANRLSYVLWRSAPDSELLRLGTSGSLLEAQVKTKQIARMMRDEKFDRFLHDFTDQWFELPRQDEIAVDTRVYKKFDVKVKPSLKAETVAFMSHLVRENLSLTNLIDSDFMVLNNAVARHYGIPGIHGSEFRVVSRSAKKGGEHRGGILTHAGILMQGGTGDRTSIVERGAFVARKIIDRPPAPPPPNAGELPTDDVNTAKMTGGQLVKHHASTPQCANCHAKIDPLGMGLEGFDAVGLPRIKETRLNPNFSRLGKRQRRNPANLVISVPLDTKGYLDAGKTFDGLSQFKRVLMTQKDGLGRGFIRALLSFVNGREANIRDAAIVEKIANKTSAEDYPTRRIIEEVLNSDAMTTY